MTCKGICLRYKAEKIHASSYYETGNKRCSRCEIFMEWEGNYCPCCGIMLRTRPKSTNDRYQLLLVRQSKRLGKK